MPVRSIPTLCRVFVDDLVCRRDNYAVSRPGFAGVQLWDFVRRVSVICSFDISVNCALSAPGLMLLRSVG